MVYFLQRQRHVAQHILSSRVRRDDFDEMQYPFAAIGVRLVLMLAAIFENVDPTVPPERRMTDCLRFRSQCSPSGTFSRRNTASSAPLQPASFSSTCSGGSKRSGSLCCTGATSHSASLWTGQWSSGASTTSSTPCSTTAPRCPSWSGSQRKSSVMSSCAMRRTSFCTACKAGGAAWAMAVVSTGRRTRRTSTSIGTRRTVQTVIRCRAQ